VFFVILSIKKQKPPKDIILLRGSLQHFPGTLYAASPHTLRLHPPRGLEKE
jgi:hypothetical protein